MPTPIVSLTVQKILPCSPAEAFRAWTVPELFQQWFIPASGMRVTATMDLRVGGKYQIRFQKPGRADPVVVDGEFLTVEAPRYLEYTWLSVHAPGPCGPADTVVKVTFNDLGDERTEIVLTHEGFADAEQGENHTDGWTSILGCMASFYEAKRSGA